MKQPRIRRRIEDPDEPDANGPDRDRADVRTRFGPGNKAAVGRSSKGAELERALRAAVTPADLADVAAKMLAKAKRGDVRAAHWLTDRMIGRARQAEREGPGLLLTVDNAAACTRSHAAIFNALASGALTLDDARELTELVALARDTCLVAELEGRIQLLEDAREEP